MQCFSCKKKKKSTFRITCSTAKKQKQFFLIENHILCHPSRSHSRLELVFFKTAIFIQFCACMCKLCLHMKINEPDNITASPEVLHDAMFP